MITRRVSVIVSLTALGGSLASYSSGPQTVRAADVAAPSTSGSWPYPNGDLANTRDAVGSSISTSNVDKLRQAWTFAFPPSSGVGGTGTLAANPIVRDGVIYLQDLDSNVYAIALSTGRLKWKYLLNQPVLSGPGPNGVAVANGLVFGAAPTSVFALNAKTGDKVWVNNTTLKKDQGTFGIQPEVADGRVYIASQYGSGAGGGVLLALSATSGKVLWRFNTTIRSDQGVKSVGLGSGGAWEPPLIGSDGSVTFGIGNPYQSIGSAFAHPLAQLYTDSDVNLDAATGKLRWYYQGVTNDFKDYDMQTSPILAKASGVPVVVGSGKMGYVYVMNATTGRLIWKAPVGEHNGHDNDSQNAMEHKPAPKLPYTYLPGSLGGVLSNLAVADNTIYVATCNVPFKYSKLSQVIGSPSGSGVSGDVEALNLSTGKVEWKTKVSTLPLGATTVSNDLVLTTLVSGELLALNRSTGAIVLRRHLPTTTNAPIAIVDNTVLVPASGVGKTADGGHPQLVAYTVPISATT